MRKGYTIILKIVLSSVCLDGKVSTDSILQDLGLCLAQYR